MNLVCDSGGLSSLFIVTARSHAERYVFETYVTAIREAPQQIQSVLHLMRSVFALTRFYDDASFQRYVHTINVVDF